MRSFVAGRSLFFQAGIISFVVAAGIAVVGVVAYRTLQRIEVNGPIYEEIVQGKDLIADICTPALSLTDTYLMTLQIVGESDPDKLLALIDQLKATEQTLNEKYDSWGRSLHDGRELQLLKSEAQPKALAFFKIINDDFLAKVLQGDNLAARGVLDGSAANAYHSHMNTLSDLLKIADEEHQKLEDESRAEVSSRLRSLSIIALLVFAVSGLMAYLFIRRLSRRLQLLASVADAIGTGDVHHAQDLMAVVKVSS